MCNSDFFLYSGEEIKGRATFLRGKSIMKAGKIVKITVSVIVLGGLAAAGNYFIGRDGSSYQTAKD